MCFESRELDADQNLDENPRETRGRRFTEQLSIAEKLVSVEMIMELLSVLFPE